MDIIALLKKGDLRTTGASDKVSNLALKNPLILREIVKAMNDNDSGVRMRSADAVQKVSEKNPDLIKPFKKEFIKYSDIAQKEVRWHLAQIYPLLDLSKTERNKIINNLISWIMTDESNIVKVFSMQAIHDFSLKDESLKLLAKKMITKAMSFKTPSILSRAKKLLKSF